MKTKEKQIILDIAKFDSGSSYFATETYITPQKRNDSLKPQPIDSLKIIKSEISKGSSLLKNLEINSLFKDFLIENKITNNNFQKIKSIEQLNKAFPHEFFSFLQKKSLPFLQGEKLESFHLQEIVDIWKTRLSIIKKKYDSKFFKKNNLIILKGLTTKTSYTNKYSHTPTIHSIKSNDNEIDIVVDFGKQDDPSTTLISTSLYIMSTIHFIAMPKGLPKNLKVLYIYSK